VADDLSGDEKTAQTLSLRFLEMPQIANTLGHCENTVFETCRKTIPTFPRPTQPEDLAARQRALVEAGGLGGEALVAGDDDLEDCRKEGPENSAHFFFGVDRQTTKTASTRMHVEESS
jgi:hypothetical protein